ncbi:MAG: glutathione S-transferase [Burkholderiales bacterium]|nr:glutathione S-transferase [Burkholderiales bacterium]
MPTPSRPIRPIRLYGNPISGHVHRVRLFLTLLDLPFEEIEIDFASGEHKRPEFVAISPFGQLPVIEDGAVTLADSNAILVYLALTYDTSRRWLPADVRTQAEVQRWFSVAAGPLAYGAASARVTALFKRPDNPQARQTAAAVFEVMERHLAAREWLATPQATIADLSMYTYTAHAPEGGVALEPWPHLQAWLRRVEALPGFVGMVRSPLPGQPA